MPRLVQVDAFTAQPFAGNPAAVCVRPVAASEAWMQAVAQEMNLSETAFLVPRPEGGFDLRWFTPGGEVDLCGHATLASAHHLWEAGYLTPHSEAQFHTLSGLLTARRTTDADGHAWITMDFPAEPPVPLADSAADAALRKTLTHALGTPLHDVQRNRMDLFAVLSDAAQLRALQPDMQALAALSARGLIVTAPTDTPDYDFLSRFFAPALGIPEDPVTGSAHCALGPYWQQRLGRRTLSAYQASPRGGSVRVEVAGTRVHLTGQAVTVMDAHLHC